MAIGDVQIGLEVKKSQDSAGKYQLYVRVKIYQNIQAELFVFQRNLDDGQDYFSHIATPAELTSLPKHQHQAGNLFFLEHTVELEFDTAKQMEDTLSTIVFSLTRLKNDWTLIKGQLDTTYDVII